MENEDELVVIPSNIHPCVETFLAYDNIDRNEETLSGGGTSHRVNGIAVQAQVQTVALPPKQENSVSVKTKRRSIKASVEGLPAYNAGARVGPPKMTLIEEDYDEVLQTTKAKNQVWTLVRQTDTTTQRFCSWTGFNIKTRNNLSVVPDSIGYLPTINAPATEMSTVYEILSQALKVMEALHLNSITCVFDQAIYAKAIEIIWKDGKFKPIVIRLGVFHTLCNLMSIIGKRFQDAGLKDVAVESGVIAEGSIEGVMEGKRYNRAVRFHKLFYETLMRIIWTEFFAWLKKTNASLLPHLNSTLEQIEKLDGEISQDQWNSLLNNPSCVKVIELFNSYLNHLRNQNGNLSAFSISYIDMVEILLGMIRASREGNWILYLATIRAMIPWTFAYDKLNYARYLPVYYAQMKQLEIYHPNVFEHMQHGGFSVQISSSNPFSRVPVDQTLEETANKDTQTAGGTKGFSLKPGAVTRYYLTAEYRSNCLRNLRKMVECKLPGVSHADLKPSRITRDEKDIKAMLQLIETTWINPFDKSNELVCLSTGAIAPNDVCSDLLDAKEKGESAFKAFKEQRLESDTPIQSTFYDKLTKLKLKTFGSIKQTKKTKVSNKEIILKADSKLFGHIILVASVRNLSMEEVLKHPLGPLPWSLANADGSMKKTNKASLARNLEKNVSPAENVSRCGAVIIDGMAIINKVNAEKKTYGELAATLFSSILRDGYGCARIDVVFDVYNDISIKNAERSKRADNVSAMPLNTIMPGHKIQQWKSVLRCSESKTTLIKFLYDEWQKPAYRAKLQGKIMYVTCQSNCVKITQEGVSPVPDLETSQEEADTRMMLHAKHASITYDAVIIVSEDTDVIILALAFYREIGELYIRCGTQTRVRYIDISRLGSSLGKEVCESLVGLHAFTGCDSVSAFSGKGKLSGLKLILKEKCYRGALAQLGKQWSLPPELFFTLQKFTCRLYASAFKCNKCQRSQVPNVQIKKRRNRILAASTMRRLLESSCPAIKLPSCHLAKMSRTISRHTKTRGRSWMVS